MKYITRLAVAVFAGLAAPAVAAAQPATAPPADRAGPAHPEPPSASPEPAVLPPASPPPRAPPSVAGPAVPTGPEWASLRLLRDKGLISDAELGSALADIGVVGAGEATTLVVAKLKATIYGYVEGNFKYDSTQTCVEFCGSSQVPRPGTYKGNHGRTIFSARDSRFGLRLAAPEDHGVRVSGGIETDFFGPSATTEQSTYVNPVLRIRTAYVKLETPVLDILVGQSWSLFGWQPLFISASVQYPGLPGETFERTPQLRLSRTFKGEAVTAELAIAANRPPQQDSSTPEGVAGIRLQFTRWTGQHTTYMANTAIQAASLGVSADLRRFRIPELSATPRSGIGRTGGGVAFSGYLPIIPATRTAKDNALSLNGEVSITRGMSDDYTTLGAAGTANAAIPAATPDGAATPYVANFDPGLAAIDAAGHVELIKWLACFASLEFYPAGTGGRLGLFANYGHMESSNARSVGTAAATKIRDHEDLFEVGVLVDPTRATRVAASGSLYDDVYADHVAAKNYSVLVSGWLFF